MCRQIAKTYFFPSEMQSFESDRYGSGDFINAVFLMNALKVVTKAYMRFIINSIRSDHSQGQYSRSVSTWMRRLGALVQTSSLVMSSSSSSRSSSSKRSSSMAPASSTPPTAPEQHITEIDLEMLIKD